MVAPNPPPLVEVALRHAAQGRAVFPLQPNGKRPLIAKEDGGHGCKDATTDEDKIRAWWSAHPAANVGIATGKASGITVLDVDGPEGAATARRLAEQHGTFSNTTRVRTRKGWHLYFRYKPGLKNKVRILGPDSGLDVRNDGGYVVAPGSVIDGHLYAITEQDGGAREWPEWLLIEQPKPKRAPAAATAATSTARPDGATAWGAKALDNVLAELAQAKEGGRNDALNAAAFRLARLHAGGELPEVKDRILDAALKIGLPQHEAAGTISSAWQAGILQPVKAPPRHDRTAATRLRVLPPEPRHPATVHEALGIDPGAPLTEEGGQLAEAPPVLEGDGIDREPEDTRDSAAFDEPDKPRIVVGVDIMRMNDEAEAALKSTSPVRLYQHAQRLVEIRRDSGFDVKWLSRSPGSPSIVAIDSGRVTELLSASALWERWDGRAEEFKPVKPPEESKQGLLSRGGQSFPPLEGIAESPFLRPDGTACTTPGYDKATGVLYAPASPINITLPEKPTKADAQQAYDELAEPFCDFQFVSSDDQAAAIAALLTIVARPAIQGPAPLFAARANQRAAGKGLLVNTISTIATGRKANAMPPADNDEEWRKRILALALAGQSVVMVDNVEGAFGCAPLASVLTNPEIEDRVLGASRTARATMRSVWFATGNNLAFKGDLGRRVVPMDQNVTVENAEDREGFRHGAGDRLLAWCREHRPRLLRAALTLLLAFHAADRPTTGKPLLGSYEAWDDQIRAPVLWACGIDPCETRMRLRQAGDADDEPIRALYGVLEEAFKLGVEFTVPEAIQKASFAGDTSPFKAALGSWCRDPNRLDARAIGRAFGRVAGRVLGGRRLDQNGRTHGGFMTYILNDTNQARFRMRQSGE